MYDNEVWGCASCVRLIFNAMQTVSGAITQKLNVQSVRYGQN